jgi:hypothetical protein
VAVTMYRDSEPDGYGDPSYARQVCPGTSGYVTNSDDCNDNISGMGPNYTDCASSTIQRKCMPGGSWSNTNCSDGCQPALGGCRPGTIGISGSVTCWASGSNALSATCQIGAGCTDGVCGTSSSPGKYQCDGPNDCVFSTCCRGADVGGSYSRCSTCSGISVICDPLASPSGCPSGYHCPANGIQFVSCEAD